MAQDNNDDSDLMRDLDDKQSEDLQQTISDSDYK
jgi:hypothetical protein